MLVDCCLQIFSFVSCYPKAGVGTTPLQKVVDFGEGGNRSTQKKALETLSKTLLSLSKLHVRQLLKNGLAHFRHQLEHCFTTVVNWLKWLLNEEDWFQHSKINSGLIFNPSTNPVSWEAKFWGHLLEHCCFLTHYCCKLVKVFWSNDF